MLVLTAMLAASTGCATSSFIEALEPDHVVSHEQYVQRPMVQGWDGQYRPSRVPTKAYGRTQVAHNHEGPCSTVCRSRGEHPAADGIVTPAELNYGAQWRWRRPYPRERTQHHHINHQRRERGSVEYERTRVIRHYER